MKSDQRIFVSTIRWVFFYFKAAAKQLQFSACLKIWRSQLQVKSLQKAKSLPTVGNNPTDKNLFSSVGLFPTGDAFFFGCGSSALGE
jgi:hypothetical protein